MQKFYFQAVTAEGKQISGYVSAENENEAHKKLRESNMSVLTLEEKKDSDNKKNVDIFDFEGINEVEKTVKGTIEASDIYSAFKKLKMEYKINLLYLIPSNVDPKEKEFLKEEGIDEELEKALQLEILQAKKNIGKKHKKVVSRESEIKQVLQSRKKEISFMQEKIDSILGEFIPLLHENEDYIDPAKKREIEERIDLLSRLKHSNSIEHLKNLTKNLLKQMESDEIFLKGSNLPDEVKVEIARRRAKFIDLGQSFEKVISKGLLDLQLKIAGFDSEILKKKMSEIHLIEKIGMVSYLTIVFLFFLCLIFWIWMFLQYILNFNMEKTLFYFESALFWYVTGFSAVASVFFSFVFAAKKMKLIEKCSYIVVGFVLLFIYTLEFPVIFHWVP
ncbi:hypothetical protein KAI58_03530 [Candidatus Gracilibacteria bacterium]|nr:hypothetical protein [Candidatus Gracilibacteria bacterium]